MRSWFLGQIRNPKGRLAYDRRGNVRSRRRRDRVARTCIRVGLRRDLRSISPPNSPARALSAGRGGREWHARLSIKAGAVREQIPTVAAPRRVINLMAALRRSIQEDKKMAARKGAPAAPARKRA